MAHPRTPRSLRLASSSRPRRPLVVALALLAVGGCRCDEDVNKLECKFEVSPSGEGQEITFAATEIGREAERTWRIDNTGNVPLRDLKAELQGNNAEHYSVDVPDDLVVNPDEDATLTVLFHPLAEADLSSRFVVSHPDVGNAKCPSTTVFVRGTGFEPLPVDAGFPDAGFEDAGSFEDAGFVDAGEIGVDGGVNFQSDDEWFGYGALEDARSGFAAVVLADGDVIVVGGYSESGEALDSIERFDPALGVARIVAHMAVPRAEPAAVLLPNGTIAIAGGRSSGVGGFALTSLETFNPTTNAVVCPPPQGACGLNELDQGALPDGRIGAFAMRSGNNVIVGLGRTLDPLGNEVVLAGADLVVLGGSLTLGAVTNANLLSARSGDARTTAADGSLLIAGGKNGGGVVLDDVLLIDAATATASSVGTLTHARSGAAVALLENGDAIVAGGFAATNVLVREVERINDALGTGTPIDDVPNLLLDGRVGASLVALPSDILIYAGGTSSRTDNKPNEESVVPRTDADVLVPFGTDAFLRLSPDNELAHGRVGHVAVVVGEQSDQVLFLGGNNAAPRRTPHPHAERYLLDENRFLTYGLMGPGTALEAGLVEGSGAALLSAGGIDPHTGGLSGAVRAFDAEHGVYVEAGELLDPRRDHTLTRLPDNISLLVAGGRDEAGQVVASATIANAIAKIDRPLPVSMAHARAGHTATRLADNNPFGPGAVLLCGGQGPGGEALDTCEIFVPPSVPQDPATYDEARFVSVANRMSTGRVGHTATLLDTGEVLLLGGGDVSTDLVTADLFIPDENAPFVTATGLPNHARRNHAAVMLGGGRVLVVGGFVFDGALGPTRTAELYVRGLGTFLPLPDMEEERGAPAAFLLANGNVIVAGGARSNTSVDDVPTVANVSSELYVPGPDGVGTFEEFLPDIPLSYGRADVLMVDVFGRAIVAGGTHRDGLLLTGAERQTPITFVDFLQAPGDAIQPN